MGKEMIKKGKGGIFLGRHGRDGLMWQGSEVIIFWVSKGERGRGEGGCPLTFAVQRKKGRGKLEPSVLCGGCLIGT